MKKRTDNKLNRYESINLYKTLQIFIFLIPWPIGIKREQKTEGISVAVNIKSRFIY